jgi:tetratricopeptide (TPR) repeat protein
MAENPLEGILGDEEEKEETTSQGREAQTDAFAAILASNLPLVDPEVARRTREYLDKQTRLLELQANQLHDTHSLHLRELRGRVSEGPLRRAGMRIRLSFQIFFATLATAIGIGAIVMLWDAIGSHSVIIEPFKTPTDLAARGTTGEVVAAGLLDGLTRLQRATHSVATEMAATGAWSGDIKVEIPETGLSIGELYRAIRERFGHDVHIEGDLTENSKGQASLTVRGSGIAAKTFSGSVDEIEALTTQAAEFVYAESQPARWSAYLVESARYAEAVEFCRSALDGRDTETRARLLNNWAFAEESLGKSPDDYLPLFESVIRLKPDAWSTYLNITGAYQILGREEDAWRLSVQMSKAAGGRTGKSHEIQLAFANVDVETWNIGTVSSVLKDDENVSSGPQLSELSMNQADMLWRLHDLDGARLELQRIKDDDPDRVTQAGKHFVLGQLAVARGDLPSALRELRTFNDYFSDPAMAANFYNHRCWLAPVEEASGNPKKADELLDSLRPLVDCARFRADIIDGRGDWGAAQAAYAKAVTLAPDLPAAYYSWGLALERHGDLPAAEAKFAEANKRQPNWADPLEAWGDVLKKEGKVSQAQEKYDAALKLAPHWRKLLDVRAELKRTAGTAH